MTPPRNNLKTETLPNTLTTSKPPLGGITGGTSNGYAQWTITTGASGGFTAALTATTTAAPFMYAMKGNVYGDWIDNYAGTTTIPTYLWNVVNAAEFGFTATTTTAADVGQSFKTAGAGLGPCNTGSNVLADTCWIGASTTAKQVMNRSTSAVSGTSLGVHFRVQINNHAVLEDTYVATTTITATTQ